MIERTSVAAWMLLFVVGCGEKAKPDQDSSASSEPGAAVSASAAVPDAPPDRSPLPVKVVADFKRLSVVGYKAHDTEGWPFGAQSSKAFRVHPFRDRMIVTQAGLLYTFDGKKLALDPKAVTTEQVPGETPPLGAYEIRRLEGSFPDVLFADAHFYSFMGPRQFSYRDVSYERKDGSWGVVGVLPGAVTAWKDGRTLTLRMGKLESVPEAPEGGVPPQSKPSDAAGCKGSAAAIDAKNLTALSSGEIFLLGRRCDTGTMGVERLGAGPAVLEELPDAPKEPLKTLIAAGSPKSVYVATSGDGKPYVARFDGRAFRSIAVPDSGEVEALWATPDGAAFLITYNRAQKGAPSLLVRVEPDGTVTRFIAPLGRRFRGLWASDKDTAFTAWDNDYGDASVLFSTKPEVIFGTPPASFSEEAPASPGADAPPSEMASLPMPAYTDACKTPFVFLYDVSPKAPPNFDFPTTRKAISTFPNLSEIKLVEFVYEKKKKLGASVPSAEVGRALITQVVRNMKDESPELSCYEPKEGLREIRLP
ncbi:MAG: hypothetical protein HOV80_31540 [Polyangiaceae bacterium]|nr:hypothetical protein [Polyangiaceae bacterium]